MEPEQKLKMGDNPPKKQPCLKEKLEAICVELIDKRILFLEAIRQFEKCFIAEVVSRNNGNIKSAADALGIHRNTLAKKIADYKVKGLRTSKSRVATRKHRKRPS